MWRSRATATIVKFIFSLYPVLAQIFPVAGLDDGRLGIGNLPGNGLLFFLFLQKISPFSAVACPKGEILCNYPRISPKSWATSRSRPGAKGLSSPAESRKERK